MVTSSKFNGSWLCAATIVGVLLPFVLILFLLPEPSDSQVEDYLPSSRARTVTLKIIKSLKLIQGESSGASRHDCVAGGAPRFITVCQGLVKAELLVHLRHFGFLTNRLVRSPPLFSL